MSKERALLKEALYVIGEYTEDAQERTEILIAEIEKLLAQPEQEPVAWKVIDKTNGNYMFSRIKPTERSYKYDVVIPLYTAPKRTPLSNEEIDKGLNGKNGFENWYDDRFVDGVCFAEKYYGIGGGE
jgi:hypothetical protein